MPTLWTYWENMPGTEMPAFYRLCWQTISRHNPSARLVGPDEIAALSGAAVLAEADGLPMAIRSDLARAWLLATFGGAWIDLDTICLGPLPWLDADLPEIAAVRQTGGFVASPWAARDGSSAAKWLLAECRRLVAVQRSGRHVRYGDTSKGVLARTVKRFRGRIVHPWRFAPVPWGDAKRVFLSRGTRQQHDARKAWRPAAVCYHLTNVVPDAFRGQTEAEILSSPTFAGHLLRKALGDPRALPGRTWEILSRLPAGPCRVAEVGVFRGLNARQLLQQRHDLTLILCDPWDDLADPTYRATGDFQAAKCCGWWKGVEREARRSTAFAGGRACCRKGTSAKVAKQVEDGSLDGAFFDGNHSYPDVRDNVREWLPKVRPGGWIGGHDYNHPLEGKRYGVKRAVDEFAAEKSLAVETGRDYTWFCRIPLVSGPTG